MHTRRSLVAAALTTVALLILAVPAFAHGVPNEDNWHVHDGRTDLGAHHKPVAFFPAIIPGYDPANDPAVCPNATDKVLLPSRSETSPVHQAGICMTNEYIIHILTLSGQPAPSGWSQVGSSNTYYKLTSR